MTPKERAPALDGIARLQALVRKRVTLGFESEKTREGRLDHDQAQVEVAEKQIGRELLWRETRYASRAPYLGQTVESVVLMCLCYTEKGDDDYFDRPRRPGMTPSNCCYDGISDVDAPRPVAFDYDGDGRTELAMTVSYRLLSLTNSERGTWRRVLTLSGDRLEDYEPAKHIEPVAIRDADGDGRPDLIEQDQHETCPPDPCDHECGCYPEDGPEIFWLSNRGGTFRKAPMSPGGR